MNILFVHEVDWLNKVVYEIHSFSELLSLFGHQVYAIDYEEAWTRRGLFDFGSLRTKVFDGVHRAYPQAAITVKRPGFIKIPVLSRLSAGATHYLEIRKTISQAKIDAIILYGVPTNGLQTVCLARRYRIPVVFRPIDIPNQLVPYRVLRSITRFLERRVYSRVDMLLTLTPRISQYVLDMGAPRSKVRLLLQGVDTELFRPGLDSTEMRWKWGIGKQDSVILFMGTLFEFSGLDIFIQHFPDILKQVPQAKLLIVGDGPLRPKLGKIIADLSLEGQVTMTGYQPYPDMPLYINLADICINPFRLNKATRDVLPTKLLQYLACGKAVVSSPLPGTQSILPAADSGMIYAENGSKMADQVAHLLGAPQRRQQLEEAGLNYAQREHGYENIARQLETTLREAISQKGRSPGKRV